MATSLEKTLPRDAYLDAGWFKRECSRIFFAEWFCVARSEELARSGDYRALTLAGQRLLLVRGDDGTIRGFFNVCRHRGCELVDSNDREACSGQFRRHIRCPYHSWTYALDGRLQHAPHLSVEREKYTLYGIELAERGGFLFARLAGGEKTLAEQLGTVPARIARYGLDELVTGWQRQYRVAANWKVILENYNECYHCAGVHPELCRIVPAFRDKGGLGLDWEAGIPQRDGTNTFTLSGTTNRSPLPRLNEVERERHFGELVYPNLMVSLAMDHVSAYLLWPLGANETLVDNRILFHPDAVSAADHDPDDAAEFWDLVNRQDWAICERVQRGMQALPFEHGYYAPMEDLSLDIRRYVGDRMK